MCITPTDVKHYLYCPGIIAAKRIGAEEPPAEYLSERRPLPPELAAGYSRIEAEVPLRRPPLRGVADYIAVDKWGGVVPIETKAGPGPPTTPEIYQLAAYMWMAETRGPVRYGILIKDKPHTIPYTSDLAEALMTIIKNIAQIYAGRDPPYVTRRCASCGYARHCIYKNTSRA
ncbi:CRISPR-associated protein Cas4 [Pyrobaculum sp. 3827-6]|nr:CRISPR-associated protein Cas4 [Pyrobaculum sp. 3827-6]